MIVDVKRAELELPTLEFIEIDIMAKYTLILVAIFCVALTSATSLAREKREETVVDENKEKPLTVEGLMSWFGDLSQNFQDFAGKHITEERKEVRILDFEFHSFRVLIPNSYFCRTVRSSKIWLSKPKNKLLKALTI